MRAIWAAAVGLDDCIDAGSNCDLRRAPLAKDITHAWKRCVGYDPFFDPTALEIASSNSPDNVTLLLMMG